MRALAEAKYHGKGNDLKLEVDFSNGEIASMKFTVLGKTELEEAKPAKAEQ